MIDEATKGKHCNASCCDYYCPQNVSGRCQAPNKCLGVEEAAELMAELEAAKREIAALRKRERGDAAKLREALKLCLRGMCGYCRMDAEARGMTTECVNGCEVMLDAKSALSAPPRNCDRPECATTKAAQDVWRKEDGGKTAYYEWLLATHEKGNNDADK